MKLVMDITDITGESEIEGYTNEVEGIALRDSIFVPPLVSTGSGSSARTSASARHADIQVTRFRDSASPKLWEACAASTDLGSVTITVFRSTTSGQQAYLVYLLRNTYISRIESESEDAAGTTFMPHVGPIGNINPSPAHGVGGMVINPASVPVASFGLSPMPVTGLPKGAPGTREVERVWFNGNEVRWTYTPYTDGVAGGVVQRGYNIRRGQVWS